MQYPDKDATELDALAADARSALWRLVFPERLEAAYRRDHRRRGLAFFRQGSLFVFALYVLLALDLQLRLPAAELARWLGLYGWVGGVILAAALLARLPRCNRWFEVYAVLGSFAAVALSVAATGLARDPAALRLTQATVVSAILVVCSVTGLRFRQALLAGGLGGVAGTLLAWGLGGSVAWESLLRSFAGASLLGMFIAYHAERRDRELFIQTYLLRAAQARTQEYAERLDSLARHDPLTGLANRRHFDEEMELEWRRAARQHSPLAVLMIDIDHFKHYNDSLGHVNGDSCLRQVAALIAAHTRRPGELAVRYGGEEFLLLFPDTDRPAACQLAGRLLESFHAARLPQAPGLARELITVSIGVAVAIPGEGLAAPAELICAADEALYAAKHAGRDAWRCAAAATPELRVRAQS